MIYFDFGNFNCIDVYCAVDKAGVIALNIL